MTVHASSSNTSRRTILLLGASGFIGRALGDALIARGYAVRGTGQGHALALDYARMLEASQWTPLLEGVDIVINAVGKLRDTPRASLLAAHQLAPIALFDACAQAGVDQVVQISALGVDGNETAYAHTKRAADRHLLALHADERLNALVVRPSLVFGSGGASTRLFMRLARMPVLMMPRPMQQFGVQPVAVRELADAIAQLLDARASGIVEIGGPRALSMAQLVATLRQQMGHAPALVMRLPDLLSQWSARAGDLVSASPWCSASLELASHDNVCDPRTLRTWLRDEPTAPEHLLATLVAPSQASRS